MSEGILDKLIIESAGEPLLHACLHIIWNYPGGTQRVVLELKIARGETEKLLQSGLEQTIAYMDRSGASEGHLVIFDRREGKTWEEKIWRRDEHWRGHTIGAWGM